MDCATTKTDLTEGRKATKTPRRVSKREGTSSQEKKRKMEKKRRENEKIVFFKIEKEKKKKRKKWKKCRGLATSFFPKNAGKNREENERKRRIRQPQVRWT